MQVQRNMMLVAVSAAARPSCAAGLLVCRLAAALTCLSASGHQTSLMHPSAWQIGAERDKWREVARSMIIVSYVHA